MKGLIAFATLVFLAAPALAQWEPPDEVLQVRVKGDGPWTMSCQWQSRKGKPMTREVRGRNDDWERLHLNEAYGGTCSYRAAPDKPLTVRLKSPLYRCTLPAPGKEACEQTFPAGASGQFDIQKRG